MVGVGIVVALPWYAYLQSSTRIRSSVADAAAGAPLPHLVPGRSAAPAPSFRLFLADSAPPHRRLWFYVTRPSRRRHAPYRGGLTPAFWPILYSETWGDYFGFWKWGSVDEPRTPSVERRLSAQSVVGVLPTFLAAAGGLALSALALLKVRLRPELMLVPLMVFIALAGCAYYAYRYPAADGDTVKALFPLPAMPSVALCFGFVTMFLAGRSRRSAVLVCAPLVIGAAVSFGFLVLS